MRCYFWVGVFFLCCFQHTLYIQSVDDVSPLPSEISLEQEAKTSTDFPSSGNGALSFLKKPVTVQVAPSYLTAVPGQVIEVAMLMSHEENWHTYWVNPGDVGAPTSILWRKDSLIDIRSLIWPVPHSFDSMGMVSYGFDKKVVLKQNFQISPLAHEGETITLTGQMSWVACAESCVPGSYDISIPIYVGSKAVPNDKYKVLLGQSDYIFPQKKVIEEEPFYLQVRRDLKSIEWTLLPELSQATAIYWASHSSASTSHLLRPSKDQVQIQSLDSSDQSGEIVFVLPKGSSVSYFVSLVDQNLSSSSSLNSENSSFALSFLFVLLLAFLGGFILNAMPCVLPVLSLKLMSFVKQAHDHKTHPFLYGLFFTIGVLISFWCLALVLILLRYYGHQVGWGFQMQSLPFVLAVFFILVLFSYNLFGFFEIGQSLTQLGQHTQSRSSIISSLLSGIFATLMATPCTAPFMGSALGYALTVSWLPSLLIFTFLGLGLSFPYLILSAFPVLLVWVPRPGQWMVVFKKSMGFLLLFSSLWILWQIAVVTSSGYLIFCLFFCIVLAIFSLIYGHYSQPQRRSSIRTIHLLLFIFVIGLSYQQLMTQGQNISLTSSTTQTKWYPYHPNHVQEVLSKGSHVFINLTASWCATCQTNKLFVLKKERIMKAFEEKGVVLFEGDWTQRDPLITQLLEKHQRAGVPFYLLIDSKNPNQPVVLPEILSVSLLADEIDKLS